GMTWRLSAALGRRVASRARRLSRGSGLSTAERAPGDSDMVRTTYSSEQYIAWMRALGEDDVECVSYNPYFGVYQSRVLERAITVPIYRQHLRLAKRFSTYPLLKTRFAAGTCDLL